MNRIVLLLLFTFSVSALAQTEDREPAAAGHPACNALKNACLKAGYVMSGPITSPKSLIGGCMAKMARGEPVKGLKVRATDPAIEPCINFMKAKMWEMSQKPSAPKPQARAFKPTPPASKHTTPPKNTKPHGK